MSDYLELVKWSSCQWKFINFMTRKIRLNFNFTTRRTRSTHVDANFYGCHHTQSLDLFSGVQKEHFVYEPICEGNNERLVVIKYDSNRSRAHQVYFYYILFSSFPSKNLVNTKRLRGGEEEDENDEVKSIIKFYESEIKGICATKITFCISNIRDITLLLYTGIQHCHSAAASPYVCEIHAMAESSK